MKCRLKDIENIIEEIELSNDHDDFLEIDEETMIWLYGPEIIINEIGMVIRKGILSVRREDDLIHLSEVRVTVFYEGDLGDGGMMYYCEVDMVKSVEEWFENRDFTKIEDLI